MNIDKSIGRIYEMEGLDEVMKAWGIFSFQSLPQAYRLLKKMTDDGELTITGTTRKARYVIAKR